MDEFRNNSALDSTGFLQMKGQALESVASTIDYEQMPRQHH